MKFMDMYCVEKIHPLVWSKDKFYKAFTVDDYVGHGVETFFWRYEAPEESQAMKKLSRSGDMSTLDTLLVFFVRRQDHEKALEGDGEVFEGRRKPARL